VPFAQALGEAARLAGRQQAVGSDGSRSSKASLNCGRIAGRDAVQVFQVEHGQQAGGVRVDVRSTQESLFEDIHVNIVGIVFWVILVEAAALLVTS
jgi:hypothetical protein